MNTVPLEFYEGPKQSTYKKINTQYKQVSFFLFSFLFISIQIILKISWVRMFSFNYFLLTKFFKKFLSIQHYSVNKIMLNSKCYLRYINFYYLFKIKKD